MHLQCHQPWWVGSTFSLIWLPEIRSGSVSVSCFGFFQPVKWKFQFRESDLNSFGSKQTVVRLYMYATGVRKYFWIQLPPCWKMKLKVGQSLTLNSEEATVHKTAIQVLQKSLHVLSGTKQILHRDSAEVDSSRKGQGVHFWLSQGVHFFWKSNSDLSLNKTMKLMSSQMFAHRHKQAWPVHSVQAPLHIAHLTLLRCPICQMSNVLMLKSSISRWEKGENSCFQTNLM